MNERMDIASIKIRVVNDDNINVLTNLRKYHSLFKTYELVKLDAYHWITLIFLLVVSLIIIHNLLTEIPLLGKYFLRKFLLCSCKVKSKE